MKGISTNDMQFFNQNDYPHNLSQNNVFEEWFKTCICQSNQYVVGIYKKKELNVVYNAVNTGFGKRLVYMSHRKVIFLQVMVYDVVY